MCVTTMDFKGILEPKLRAVNNASAPRSRGPRNDKRNWASEPLKGRRGDLEVMDVMKMIGAFTNRLESFTRRFESPNSLTQSYKDITPNASDVWVKRVLMHKHYNMSMYQYFLCSMTLFGCLLIGNVI